LIILVRGENLKAGRRLAGESTTINFVGAFFYGIAPKSDTKPKLLKFAKFP
jgi:hypothetical protein